MTTASSRWSAPRLLLAALVAAYALYFSWLTLTRYAAFEARALDMGNLNQAIWNTAHGNWFHQTNQPGVTNRLSLHVEPILLPVSLLYRLYAGPEILLVVQALVVALGALPTFALAKRELENEWLGLLFAAAFLLSPAVQGANWLEFHPLTLAPTFLLAAFYFLRARRVGWFALFAVLAASTKEEIGLLVAMMGLYAAIFMRWPRLGIPTFLLGVGWPLVAVLVVQQNVGGNIHWDRYGYLGETPGQMLRTLLVQPGVVLAQLGKADAVGYLGLLLLPVAFTALFAPEVLLMALPSLAINLLADFPPMHQVGTLIYAAPVAPFVIMAGIMGTARLRRWVERWQKEKGKGEKTALDDEQPAHAGEAGRAWALYGVVAVAMLAALIAAQARDGYLPGGGNFRLYTVADHHRNAAPILAQIGPDDRLSSQDKLNPHVSGRATSYIFPRLDDADAALVDVTGPAWPQHPNDLYKSVQELLRGDFGVAAAADGYIYLKQGAPEKELPEAFYTPWRAPTAAPAVAQEATFGDAGGDALRLLGYEVANDANGELVVRLWWQALRPLDADLRFRLLYRNAAGETLFDSEFYQPVAALWYPTAQWTPGETVLVQSLPWTLAEDAFTLDLGLYAGENPNAGRLALSDAGGLSVLEDGALLRLGSFERAGDGWTPVEPEE